MKISAVIAEFNPFHNGHEYLLQKTHENSDAVLCVMSGSFVQRGETALFDKWTRAEAAVRNGADLVVELPAVFACATAERFAFGAVSLINSLGCIDELSFGAESDNLETLIHAAQQMLAEDREISSLIKKCLSEGDSFPIARQKAFAEFISSDVFLQPNNMLAIEYIKALKKTKSSVKPNLIKRTGAAHDSAETKDGFSSASALRKMILSGKDISAFVPHNLKSLYKCSEIYDFHNLGTAMLYKLRSVSADELEKTSDVSEGLENRIKSAAAASTDIPSLIDNIYSKRYTKARVRRIITAALLGIEKSMLRGEISYIRVLAFNDTGRKILREIKEKSELPLITKVSDFKADCPMLEKDILATDIAALCAKNEINKTSGKDYLKSPIYIKSE